MSHPRPATERPRTSAAWPRLTKTLPVQHPQKCGECGCWARERLLTLWQEHDEKDQPEPKFILLCEPCGEKIIEPHVRLYASMDRNSPAPGAMELCVDCKYRDGLWCSRAKCNGGEGVTISVVTGMRGFIDGRDSKGRSWGHPFVSYGSAPSACSGKATA